MKKLKDIRQKRNLTITELAEKIHVSPAAISQYESQKRQPTLDIVKELADAAREAGLEF